MAKVSSNQVMSDVDVTLAMPEWRLPDAASVAEDALAAGLKFCVQKMALAGQQTAIGRLQQGDGTARSYCYYGIARHLAESLGALDENVKAVYVVDFDATADDVSLGEKQTSLIHLIAWAERKTSALDSLVEALDRALLQHYTDLVGKHQLAHLLDVQVVDDADVKNRVGYGAMLSSLYQRPIQVWKR